MTYLDSTNGPVTEPAASDLSDSLDIRFLVAGELSPSAIAIRRDRAELVTVLAGVRQPRAEERTHLERTFR